MKLNDIFNMKYYLNLKNFPNELSYYDKEGIPMICFYATGEIVYNPTVVALFALSNLQLYFSGERTALNKFNQAVNWLIRNGVHTKIGLIFPLNFDHPVYGLKKGWISAMTQGVVISSFIRSFLLSSDHFFLTAAQEALGPLMVGIEHGGVSYHDENGDLWLEEVPSNPPSHILNGFIFALMGLFDLLSVTGDSLVEDILKKGVLTLKKNIRRYDSGYWSLYQLTPALLAPLDYHKLHIDQLLFLYKLTGEDIFRDCAVRFYVYMGRQRNYLISRILGNILYLNALFKMKSLNAVPYMLRRICQYFSDKIRL